MVSLLDIVDIEDSEAFMPRYLFGDDNGDGRLDFTELWVTSHGVMGAPTTALLGEHVNTTTVTAIDGSRHRIVYPPLDSD